MRERLSESRNKLTLLDMYFSSIKITRVDQSLESSKIAAATDNSFNTKNLAEISEFETNWEEDEGGRDRIYCKIRSSYPAWRLSNAQVRK